MKKPQDDANNTWPTINAMRDRGGGFVKALAELWIRADDQNRKRIVVAFSDYFYKYRKVAEDENAPI